MARTPRLAVLPHAPRPLRCSDTLALADTRFAVSVKEIEPQCSITGAELDAIERLLGEALTELLGQQPN